MNRRGFLRALTKIAVAVQAAPALATIERFSPVPADMLDQAEAIGSLKSFNDLLNAYLTPGLLMAEIMRPNWFLKAIKKEESGAEEDVRQLVRWE